MEIILNPVPARVCVCAETKEMTDEIANYIKSFVTPVETRLFSVYRGDEIIGLMREMQNSFDLCILCGDLPGMPATAVTELFQVMQENTDVILMGGDMEFTSSSRESEHIFYLAGKELGDEFRCALGRMLLRYRLKNSPLVRIRSTSGPVSIFLQSVVYATRSGRSVTYMLRDGRVISGVTVRGKLMDELNALAGDSLFQPCGVSTVVNIALVRRLGNNAIVFRDGRTLSVPHSALKDFEKRLEPAREANFL